MSWEVQHDTGFSASYPGVPRALVWVNAAYIKGRAPSTLRVVVRAGLGHSARDGETSVLFTSGLSAPNPSWELLNPPEVPSGV